MSSLSRPDRPSSDRPNPDRPSSDRPITDRPTVYLQRARAIVRQALNRYTSYFKAAQPHPPNPAVETQIQRDHAQLTATLQTLEQQVMRIAVFGLVSRGKSAVLNALIGRKQLPTGPLNGVTLTPQTVAWSLDGLPVDLIDTPGLDEIDGQTRAEMAATIARQADLILFVVSGDITRTEFQALCDLRQSQKPLLVVFNKTDLYPEQTQVAIYQSLQRLANSGADGHPLPRSLSTDEIVLIAAEPAPLQVRVEHPDGRVTYAWEAPAPLIEDLREKIQAIAHREGRTLMALNALVQVQAAERRLAPHLIAVHESEAEALIWRFVRYKAIAIAANPVAVLDVLGGVLSDLAMIRALAELYGLPITGHEVNKLWRTIFFSSGSLLFTEIGSGLVLGAGKSAAAVTSGVDAASGFTAYAGTAIAQASFAGLGSYTVGRAAQLYLENGCSWGPQGASTAMQSLLQTLDTQTILYRIRQEFSDRGL